MGAGHSKRRGTHETLAAKDAEIAQLKLKIMRLETELGTLRERVRAFEGTESSSGHQQVVGAPMDLAQVPAVVDVAQLPRKNSKDRFGRGHRRHHSAPPSKDALRQAVVHGALLPSLSTLASDAGRASLGALFHHRATADSETSTVYHSPHNSGRSSRSRSNTGSLRRRKP